MKKEQATNILIGIVIVAIIGVLIFALTASPLVAPEQSGERATNTEANITMIEGLQIETLQEGTESGAVANKGTTAVVHYVGTLTDGTKFDSSRDKGTPFDFIVGAGQVIEGWDKGVEGMRVGEIRKLTVAPELGYGARAIGPIPPNSTLVFEVELLEVR